MKNLRELSIKNNFLNLRWLIIIATSYMGIFASDKITKIDYIHFLIVFFIISNIALYFLSYELFLKNIFKYLIFICDIILVTLGIYLTSGTNTDFFLLYFLVIVITAIGQDIKGSIIATIIASLLYLSLLLKTPMINIYDVNLFMRIPFLFVVGLFTGFLSETVKKKEIYIKDLKILLELANVLSETMDVKKLVVSIEPYFNKINKINNWDIVLYDSKVRKFNFLRGNLLISISKFDPEIFKTVIKKMLFYKGKVYYYFPLIHNRKAIGFLRIEPNNKIKFNYEDVTFFMTFCSEFALAFERVRLYNETKYLADTDRVTGLYNYAYFLEILDKKVKDSNKFIILMIDLDNFKQYNDTYGHVEGNKFLKKVAEELKMAINNNGILARYGGDEFVAIIEKYDNDVLRYLEGIKNNVEYNLLQYESKIKVTLSMGYSIFPDDASTSEEIIIKADKSLYKAKMLGKDRIAYL
jgi:diguanylate cyclase (GGDEF)-like protein